MRFSGKLVSVATISVWFVSHLIAPPKINGQAAGATLSGTVSDASGAVIPSAEVTIENTATGVTRHVTTDAAGFYTAPNLQPSSYEITVSAPGFTTHLQTGITLAVGAQQVLNVTMQVGQTTEKVEVTGEAPTIQLISSSVSAEVNGTTVRELPLNGRSWTDLASLQLGVASISGQTQAPYNQGSFRGNRGFGGQLSISGARPQQNNYRLDGISINDYANGGPGSVLGGNLGVDAIQEFSVLTSNYSTEYGRSSGGIVNAVTRSGTNQFHGDAYEFHRNSALDARNFFDGPQIPPFKRNQFGASVGGPIRKDRTFIFADYEGIAQSLGITSIITVPSSSALAGKFCSTPPADGSCTTQQLPVGPNTDANGIDLAVKPYLGFFVLPNGPLLGNGDIGIYTFVLQQIVNENFFTTRVDHKFSGGKDNLFGTYMFDNAPFTTPDSLNQVVLGNKTVRQVVVLEENHIFSSGLLNSLRFGFNRSVAINNESVKAINPLAADKSLAVLPGQYPVGFGITGLSAGGGGLGNTPEYTFHYSSFQAYNDAFLTHGLHTLKFGIAVERIRDNASAFKDINGGFSFNSLSDFLTNHPKSFRTGFAGTLTPRGFRQTLFGAYVNDDVRFRPNLTFNLGLRYEMATVPTEVQGKLSTLRQITDTKPHLGDPFFMNSTPRNFEPRVGFAWDPFHDGKTALRGGFGIYDVLPLPYEIELLALTTEPFYRNGTINTLPAGAFPSGALSLLTKSSSVQAYVEPHPHRNYVMQWNLNVQRQLANNLTMLMGYVGSRAVHQPFKSDDINLVVPTLTPQGYLWPSPAGSGTVINPNVGAIRGMMWAANSFYDALVLQMTKKMSRGFQVQGSYTWGKSIDNSSATLAGDAFSNSIDSQHWFDLRLGRGLSDFNVGHILVINGIWQVPAVLVTPRRVAWVLNGWELGGIYKASDGVPFTPSLAADPLGLNSSTPWDFPNRLVGPGCESLVNPGNPNNYIKTPCFAFPVPATLRGNAGRNILIGPGLSNFDFSLFKNNHIKGISENFNAQFRVEIFNLLNHANFALPTKANSQLFDARRNRVPTAGLITATSTTSRQVQLALKLIW